MSSERTWQPIHEVGNNDDELVTFYIVWQKKDYGAFEDINTEEIWSYSLGLYTLNLIKIIWSWEEWQDGRTQYIFLTCRFEEGNNFKLK
jgi:hypothetical protein